MLMHCLAFALLSLVPLAPAREVPALKLSAVTAVATMGTELVLVVGDVTYVAEAATVTLAGDSLILGGGYTSFASAPNILTAEYIDRFGVNHKIETNCNGQTREACFLAHRKMVELYQSVYPPK